MTTQSTPAVDRTAVDLAADVRSARLSAVDSTRAALDRLAERDGDIAAFQVVRRDAALKEAAAVDARVAAGETLPMAGVPVAIKDNVPVEGEPMRDGSAATDAHPQPHDHEVVRRLRTAGAVVVGITRVPELCVFAATDSVYAVTRNPWSTDLTPGGSSGGSAAAVSAGIVPVAHGNDGMGSVRIPAACCGLVGIKPGAGVVPCDLGETDWYGLSENGALGTTVADVALMLSVLADDASLADVADAADAAPLRVAVSVKPPLPWMSVDREHVRAVFETAGLLLRDGHDVERHDASLPTKAAVSAFARWFAGTAADAEHLDPDLLERRVRVHAALGRVARDRGLLEDSWRDDFKTQVVELLTTYDVLLTPVLAHPPIAARRWGDTSWLTTMAAHTSYAPFSAAWNLAQVPAMSVPAGVHPVTGTPLSVQLVARPGRESLLLSLAARLETLRPWQRLAPDYA